MFCGDLHAKMGGFCPFNPSILEWITHGKMKALVLLEARDIVESTLAGIVWQMQTDTPIHTHHKHTHVVTDT